MHTLLRPAARTEFQTKVLQRGIRLVGPATEHPVDTETLRSFKKIGSHIIGIDNDSPMLCPIEGRIGAINRHGLVLPGRLVEGQGQHKGTRVPRVHLCRQHPCQSAQVGCVHVQSYGLLGGDDELNAVGCWRALCATAPTTTVWGRVLQGWASILTNCWRVMVCQACRRRADLPLLLQQCPKARMRKITVAVRLGW
eukprot:5689604-Amphidinium_carterae.1